MSEKIYAYPAIFEWGETSIGVRFPDLPGCFSAGNSLKEAKRMAKEALALHLANLSEPLPKPSPCNVVETSDLEDVCLITVHPQDMADVHVPTDQEIVALEQWLEADDDDDDYEIPPNTLQAISDQCGMPLKDLVSEVVYLPAEKLTLAHHQGVNLSELLLQALDSRLALQHSEGQ
ncbi:MAG: type II toxin-antitoxin system HicB family antitoxin [Planctomycetia bacterium]|nr:type II toxin-antitoxin system HicB family antitoxin [Planctomycetia bacterium]